MKLNKLLPFTLLIGLTLTSCGYSEQDINQFILDTDSIANIMRQDNALKDISYTSTINFNQGFGSNVSEYSFRTFATFDADTMIKKERQENLKGNGTSEIIETYYYIEDDNLFKVNMGEKTYEIISINGPEIGQKFDLGFKNEINDVLSMANLGLKNIKNDYYHVMKEEFSSILGYDDPSKIKNDNPNLSAKISLPNQMKIKISTPLNTDVEDDKMHLEARGVDELKVDANLYSEISYSHVMNAEAKYKLNDKSEYRHAIKEESKKFVYKDIKLTKPDISEFTLIE